MTEPYDQQTFTLQEWDNAHPRWEEFVQCLEQTAPEQAPFVLGEYSRHLPCYLCVALQNEQVVGFLRFGIQPIGPEAHCPPLVLNDIPLTEAKIHAFAVREERRGQGIGTALQRWAIRRARELGCFQVASYSSYGREANYHVKLSLGFGAQPEAHGDNQQGVYFIMPLQVDALTCRALHHSGEAAVSEQQSSSVEIAKAILDAFNAHDLDRIMDFFADDCSLDMPRGPDQWGQRLVGKAAVREGLAGRFKGLPDVHYGEDRHWGSGNMVASEWLLTGTKLGGEKVRVRGCDHYEFRDGKVVRKDSYWKIVEKQ